MAKRKMAKRKKKSKKLTTSRIFTTKLDQMRSQIQNLESRRVVENKRIDRMKNTATQMEKTAAESKAALERYRTTLMILDRERKTFEQEYSKQKANSLAVLKKKTAAIETLTTRYDEYRDGKARDYQAAKIKGNKANQEWEAAKKLFDRAEKDYRAVLSYQQEIEKSFVELRNLKQRIEKEQNHRNKYFLNEEFKVLLPKPRLKPYKILVAEITRAFNSLNSARERLAEKGVALDSAEAEAESLKSELEMIDRNRGDEILAKL